VPTPFGEAAAGFVPQRRLARWTRRWRAWTSRPWPTQQVKIRVPHRAWTRSKAALRRAERCAQAARRSDSRQDRSGHKQLRRYVVGAARERPSISAALRRAWRAAARLHGAGCHRFDRWAAAEPRTASSTARRCRNPNSRHKHRNARTPQEEILPVCLPRSSGLAEVGNRDNFFDSARRSLLAPG